MPTKKSARKRKPKRAAEPAPEETVLASTTDLVEKSASAIPTKIILVLSCADRDSPHLPLHDPLFRVMLSRGMPSVDICDILSLDALSLDMRSHDTPDVQIVAQRDDQLAAAFGILSPRRERAAAVLDRRGDRAMRRSRAKQYR